MSLETRLFDALSRPLLSGCFARLADYLARDLLHLCGYRSGKHRLRCIRPGCLPAAARSLRPDYDGLADLRLAVFAAIEAAFESAERQMDIPEFEPDARLHRRIIAYLIFF
ncbi:cytoplasmic hypothetical protein [Candidatus Glomeribacter gigasporarum BEG34]|uniref:Uncharacterized protein n=1 Tax=Candidatus Glomeribacter gigasporarum BEG34 TaxID=1070319 RepID=G2JAU3_9BURK|nr:hypothetical protein [Candidatus Glomeribacter gigasporarum]CCD29895.1 cytoplasmic hypothetical protein [Candidatus Glomeribacter gigasporarum BEG34]